MRGEDQKLEVKEEQENGEQARRLGLLPAESDSERAPRLGYQPGRAGASASGVPRGVTALVQALKPETKSRKRGRGRGGPVCRPLTAEPPELTEVPNSPSQQGPPCATRSLPLTL